MEHQNGPGDLPDQWRERAGSLRAWGAEERVARIWEIAATELEQALHSSFQETLNLTEAAKVSGYSPDHLGVLVRKGKIPNAGRKNAPRIRRADLQIKEGHAPPERRRSEPHSISPKARAIAEGLRKEPSHD